MSVNKILKDRNIKNAYERVEKDRNKINKYFKIFMENEDYEFLGFVFMLGKLNLVVIHKSIEENEDDGLMYFPILGNNIISDIEESESRNLL